MPNNEAPARPKGPGGTGEGPSTWEGIDVLAIPYIELPEGVNADGGVKCGTNGLESKWPGRVRGCKSCSNIPHTETQENEDWRLLRVQRHTPKKSPEIFKGCRPRPSEISLNGVEFPAQSCNSRASRMKAHCGEPIIIAPSESFAPLGRESKKN